MSKLAVVYWSGTGNTEIMANEIADGAKSSGADVSIFTPEDFSVDKMDDYEVVAFGCPAMGEEELEDTEFEPMFEACKGKLKGKKIALFGSYDWGDGEWIRIWQDDCKELGAEIVVEPLIVNLEPDEEGKEDCRKFGSSIVA